MVASASPSLLALFFFDDDGDYNGDYRVITMVIVMVIMR